MEDIKVKRRNNQIKRLADKRNNNKLAGKKDLRVALTMGSHVILAKFKKENGLSSKEEAVELMLSMH